MLKTLINNKIIVIARMQIKPRKRRKMRKCVDTWRNSREKKKNYSRKWKFKSKKT